VEEVGVMGTKAQQMTPIQIRGPKSFDAEKAIQAILYIANRLGRKADIYKVLKVIYFADREHLAEWGRLMFGESYLALNYGPVPGESYNIIRFVRDGVPCCSEYAPARDAFRIDGNLIIPFLEAESDLLSPSERECLDRQIKACRNLTFNQLKERSHDLAYERADENGLMSVESIAASLPDRDLLLEHLQDPFPG
jgi:uncharacterized phage-associated protein